MSFDTNVINDNLRLIIVTLLQLDANYMRPANQNAPTGTIDKPFGTLLVGEVDNVGVDYAQLRNDSQVHELTEITEGLRSLIVNIQFFRGNALSLASRIGALLRSAAGVRSLNEAGLALVRVGKASDISQAVDSYFEARAQIELEFTAAVTEQTTVGTFASIPIIIQTETNSTALEVNLDS
jgi:hypothetical protein